MTQEPQLFRRVEDGANLGDHLISNAVPSYHRASGHRCGRVESVAKGGADVDGDSHSYALLCSISNHY